jgi:Membrane protein involved in the export of O-antigen and teichoic acid
MSQEMQAAAQTTVAPPMAETSKKSYGQILKSSAVIGGSTAFNMLFSIIRNKAMAVLLGTSGFGLLGLYVSISDVVRSVAGLGINTSGVRQIAESVGSGDTERIARTVTTLRRVALYSGAVGALLLVVLCRPVSMWTFGNYDHAGAVALLALVAFLLDISEAQKALVQGMRRIADLARMNILGALAGTVFSIAIVYFWKEQGLVPSLICVAAMSIVTSWWYARKIKVAAARISWREVYAEASELVKLGVVFMASGLATFGAAYLIRALVYRNLGANEAGLYTAAWGLAGMCISFILQAMGADFYPRLTAVVNKKEECNRLVNEQVEVGFLMAGPAILGALSLAPLGIMLFYSQKFGGGVEILRWLCLGMFLRVLTWPMGFIIVAKGERKIFFWTEILTNLGYVALVWVGIKTVGLNGTGMAFFALYVFNSIVVYVIVRRLTGFSWSAENRKLALVFIPLVGIVFVSWYFLPPVWAAVVGTALTIPAGYFSMKTLCRLVPLERLPKGARKIISLLGLAPKQTISESN